MNIVRYTSIGLSNSLEEVLKSLVKEGIYSFSFFGSKGSYTVEIKKEMKKYSYFVISGTESGVFKTKDDLYSNLVKVLDYLGFKKDSNDSSLGLVFNSNIDLLNEYNDGDESNSLSEKVNFQWEGIKSIFIKERIKLVCDGTFRETIDNYSWNFFGFYPKNKYDDKADSFLPNTLSGRENNQDEIIYSLKKGSFHKRFLQSVKEDIDRKFGLENINYFVGTIDSGKEKEDQVFRPGKIQSKKTFSNFITALGSETGIPVIFPELTKKGENMKKNKDMGSAENRLENKKDSYDFSKCENNKIYLFIDDILTSGSTYYEFGRNLGKKNIVLGYFIGISE